MEKQFVISLMTRMPEATKASKSTFYFKATSKFIALLKACRKAKISHGRIDGIQPAIESYLYIAEVG